MSFYGTSMIFDGIACEEMGLVLYDFDSAKQEETSFSSGLSILEDRIDGRYRPLHYGGTINESLTFTMVLCASEDRVYRNEPFDRWDLQKIASWLTGHTEYKWLHIVQPDMENIRYRCIITDLKTVEVSGTKWGFSCKVNCDSPFAYLLPEQYTAEGDHGCSLEIFGKNTNNSYYAPTIHFENTSTVQLLGFYKITVENEDRGYFHSFVMRNVPSVKSFTIDCENEIITSLDVDNMYQYVEYSDDFHFPRLYSGKNVITFSGGGTYVVTCEWPVNVGG